MRLDAAGHRTSPDTAWNDTFSAATNRFILGGDGPNPVSGGGGRSVVFSRPGYQRQERTVTGARRGVPDISMSAACDGAVDVFQSFPGQPAGWYPTCGTSEATPLFAGIVALSAQVAGHPLGLINPALYAMSAALTLMPRIATPRLTLHSGSLSLHSKSWETCRIYHDL